MVQLAKSVVSMACLSWL